MQHVTYSRIDMNKYVGALQWFPEPQSLKIITKKNCGCPSSEEVKLADIGQNICSFACCTPNRKTAYIYNFCVAPPHFSVQTCNWICFGPNWQVYTLSTMEAYHFSGIFKLLSVLSDFWEMNGRSFLCRYDASNIFGLYTSVL